MQGSGFSGVIAGLEAELKTTASKKEALTTDNKALAGQIRAKDRELISAGAQLEQARAIMVENKASSCEGLNLPMSHIWHSIQLTDCACHAEHSNHSGYCHIACSCRFRRVLAAGWRGCLML